MSKNEKVEDTVLESYFKTDARRANLSLILLSLFIPWGQLLYLFLIEGVIIARYKDYNEKIWAKCEKFPLSYIKFYAQNVCQIRKSRIKVKTNLTIHTDACEAAKFAVDNWCDAIIDITGNSNDKSKIDGPNVNLAEFRVYTEILLAVSVRKICYR